MTPELVDAPRLRHALRALRERVGLELTALGQGLYEVRTRHLYRGWGFASFISYAQRDLDLDPMTACKLARVYEWFRNDWDRAQRVGYHRLYAAAPLVVAGRMSVPAVLDLVERPKATVRALRAVVVRELAPPLECDGPDPLPDEDHTQIPWGPKDPQRRQDPSDPLPTVRGLKIVSRARGVPGRPEQVLVALSLSRSAYNRLLGALATLPEGDLERRLVSLCAAACRPAVVPRS